MEQVTYRQFPRPSPLPRRRGSARLVPTPEAFLRRGGKAWYHTVRACRIFPTFKHGKYARVPQNYRNVGACESSVYQAFPPPAEGRLDTYIQRSSSMELNSQANALEDSSGAFRLSGTKGENPQRGKRSLESERKRNGSGDIGEVHRR